MYEYIHKDEQQSTCMNDTFMHESINTYTFIIINTYRNGKYDCNTSKHIYGGDIIESQLQLYLGILRSYHRRISLCTGGTVAVNILTTGMTYCITTCIHSGTRRMW